MKNSLAAISPIDGRYFIKTKELANYFSEYALIKYRIYVEIEYFIALSKEVDNYSLTGEDEELCRSIHQNFSIDDAARVKEIEGITNHDVKAVEYFIKEQLKDSHLTNALEFVHFGLTSQDINNTAIPLSIQDAMSTHVLPLIQKVEFELVKVASIYKDVPLLARTHGQAASPTRLGKELEVFKVRLLHQIEKIKSVEIAGKFGGATGNMNAHFVAYPEKDWHQFATNFLEKNLGIKRNHPTTQIDHYDQLAELFQTMSRANTILMDFCKDMWTYISMDYFKQKIKKDEVGSSAMPHKVNPIDFENAEGNLGIANSLFQFLANKLPISRLQRDLTDSTVLRNVGVPFGHSVIAYQSILKGLSKLLLNEQKIHADLENNWPVVAEAIQTILRREGVDQPYEQLKALTRNNNVINQQTIHTFIDELKVNDSIKRELKAISPFNYLGR